MKVLSVINNDKDAVTKEYVDSKAGVTAVDPTSGPVETDFFIPTKTSELTNDSGFITEAALTTKQDILVSGTNIKTINNESILGSGNLDILNMVYPVGSIYMSVNATNPEILFGGTWVSWGTGRVPVGVDTTQSEFNTVEKTGGEKTHTLTIDEMPTHTHSLAVMGGSEVYSGFSYVNGGSFNNNFTHSTGSGQAHNNLQPYITCYMWKRTA